MSASASQRGPQDRYRWRGRRSVSGRLLGGLYRIRLSIGWAALLLVALALFAWLIYLLLLAPIRTPVVVLASGPYRWPLPPNALAAEDIDKLGMLDGKTITIRGAEEPVLSRPGVLERLKNQIDVSRKQNADLPVIVWLSMHGVYDAATEKCYLIPTQASPTDVATWVELDEIFAQLDKIRDRNVLLILDSQRMQVNWNIGLTANQFVQRAQERFEDRKSPKLAMFLTAGANEQGAVSPLLKGSVFGHYVRQGLAGAADAKDQLGVSDGWVTLSELQKFVGDHVGRWTKHHLGLRQGPVLLLGGKKLDFRLAKSLNPVALGRLLAADRKSGQLAATVPASRLDGLWRRLDDFREVGLYHREPVQWRNLEHRMLWLEQISDAGSTYSGLALCTVDEIETQTEAIQERLNQAKQTRSAIDFSNVISGGLEQVPPTNRLHSLPLAEFFGARQNEAVDGVRTLVDSVQQQPSRALLALNVAQLDSRRGTEFESARFLRMLDRYNHTGIWRDPKTVGALLRLRQELQNVSASRDVNGLPIDERIHAWTRGLIAPADEARRRAEDAIFVQGSPGVAELIAETKGRLERASSQSEALRDSRWICDQAMAELPYLAQWMTHPLQPADANDLDEQITSNLLPLIKNTSELSKRLASDSPVVIDDLLGFSSESVEKPLQAMSSDWKRTAERLIDASESADATLVGQIQALLSTPIVGWEDRRALRSSLIQLTGRLNILYEDEDYNDEDVESAAEPNDESAYPNRFTKWGRHPLAAILEQDDDDQSPGEGIDRCLDAIEAQIAAATSGASLTDRRRASREAARRLRTAAPIWFAAPKQNPVVLQRQYEWLDILFAHADRSLADFWGPAGQERAFYELATADYLTAAKEFARFPLKIESPEELGEFKARALRLEANRLAAKNGIAIEPSVAIQVDSDDTVHSVVTLKSPTPSNGGQTASGEAAIFIQANATGRLESAVVSPASAEFPKADARIDVRVPSSLALQRLQAVSMFRGHEYANPIRVDRLSGITIDVAPHDYQKSEVTLNSPGNKLSVVFILDCSRSMNNPLMSLAPVPQSRLDVAKTALEDILLNLGLRQNVRAGIQFFGHRLGWSTNAPLRQLKRPSYAGVIDDGVTASEDVESVLPLGSFDLATAKAVVPRVSGVQAWGQSPLYLAVVNAINDFGADDADANRHVIVITDGANYQFVPDESDIQATGGDDVRNAWRNSQVPVHILGLGMNRADDQAAINEFRDLCRDTGGRFTALAGSTDLTKALASLLGPGMYRLEADSEFAVRQTVGTPIDIRPAPRVKQAYKLAYEGKTLESNEAPAPPATLAAEDIWFEGGESLQLFVNEAGWGIEAYAFDSNVAASSRLIDGLGQPTDHVIRLHRAKRDPLGNVLFPISWQRFGPESDRGRSSWRVTHRPERVWVEIAPESSPGRSYVFYDANFEPGQPVPLINFVARDWPRSAFKAQVRVWCQPPGTEAAELLGPEGTGVANQAGVTDVNIASAIRAPVRVAPGVTMQVNDFGGLETSRKIRFLLKLDEQGPAVHSLKVDFPESMSVKPSRIVRRFDTVHRLAVHDFYFEEAPREMPELIQLSTRAHELRKAWRQMGDSLIVDIAEPGLLLPVASGNVAGDN